MAAWWRMNWDYVLLWLLVFAAAFGISELLGGIDHTITEIRSRY